MEHNHPIDPKVLARAEKLAASSPIPGWLITKHVAALCDLDISQVSMHARSGRIASTKVGTIRLFKPEDVARFRKYSGGNPNCNTENNPAKVAMRKRLKAARKK